MMVNEFTTFFACISALLGGYCYPLLPPLPLPPLLQTGWYSVRFPLYYCPFQIVSCPDYFVCRSRYPGGTYIGGLACLVFFVHQYVHITTEGIVCCMCLLSSKERVTYLPDLTCILISLFMICYL